MFWGVLSSGLCRGCGGQSSNVVTSCNIMNSHDITSRFSSHILSHEVAGACGHQQLVLFSQWHWGRGRVRKAYPVLFSLTHVQSSLTFGFWLAFWGARQDLALARGRVIYFLYLVTVSLSCLSSQRVPEGFLGQAS